MKFFVALLLTALLSFAGALYLPWWIVAVAAYIVGLFIHQPPFKAFSAAFIGLFFLWGLHAFYIDVKNEHLLATKVAALLPLGGSYIALIFLTAFIAGIVGGMAALTASFTLTSKRVSKKVSAN